jgi:carbonic anhydrase
VLINAFVLACFRSEGKLKYTASTWEVEIETETCPDHLPPTVQIFGTTYYLVQFHFHGVR